MGQQMRRVGLRAPVKLIIDKLGGLQEDCCCCLIIVAAAFVAAAFVAAAATCTAAFARTLLLQLCVGRVAGLRDREAREQATHGANSPRDAGVVIALPTPSVFEYDAAASLSMRGGTPASRK